LVHRRSAFEQLIGGILHQKQEWFHGALDRDESVQRLETFSRLGTNNQNDGLFLVRERVQANSFALCVFYHSTVYHYKLDMNKLGQLSIENGTRFENLLQVVDHYSRTADGLLCKLEDPCPVSYFRDSGGKNTMSAVRHGPQRIHPIEVTITGQLGECGVYTTVSYCVALFLCGNSAIRTEATWIPAIVQIASIRSFSMLLGLLIVPWP